MIVSGVLTDVVVTVLCVFVMIVIQPIHCFYVSNHKYNNDHHRRHYYNNRDLHCKLIIRNKNNNKNGLLFCLHHQNQHDIGISSLRSSSSSELAVEEEEDDMDTTTITTSENNNENNNKSNRSDIVIMDNTNHPNMSTVIAELSQRFSIPIFRSPIDMSSSLAQNDLTSTSETKKQQSIIHNIDSNGAIAAAIPSHIVSIIPYAYDSHSKELNAVIDDDYAIGIIHIDHLTTKRNDKKLNDWPNSIRQLLVKPYYIDFVVDNQLQPSNTNRLARRVSMNGPKQNQQQPDLLLKAMGTLTDNTIIYDLTAGLGRDSYLLASALASLLIRNNASTTTATNNTSTPSTTPQRQSIQRPRVHMVERNPILSMLLQDAIRRLHRVANATTSSSSTSNNNNIQQLSNILSFEMNDGIHALTRFIDNTASNDSNDDDRPDIIYLDPMFPNRKKKALVKKDMQILHSLFSHPQQQQPHGDDTDDDINTDDDMQIQKANEEYNLLLLSYQVVTNRVVVKRPINAPSLGQAAAQAAVARLPITRKGTDPNDNDNNEHQRRMKNSMNTRDDVFLKRNNILLPSYQIVGSVNRWDVYIQNEKTA